MSLPYIQGLKVLKKKSIIFFLNPWHHWMQMILKRQMENNEWTICMIHLNQIFLFFPLLAHCSLQPSYEQFCFRCVLGDLIHCCQSHLGATYLFFFFFFKCNLVQINGHSTHPCCFSLPATARSAVNFNFMSFSGIYELDMTHHSSFRLKTGQKDEWNFRIEILQFRQTMIKVCLFNVGFTEINMAISYGTRGPNSSWNVSLAVMIKGEALERQAWKHFWTSKKS